MFDLIEEDALKMVACVEAIARQIEKQSGGAIKVLDITPESELGVLLVAYGVTYATAVLRLAKQSQQESPFGRLRPQDLN